jgi:hypothetical protein
MFVLSNIVGSTIQITTLPLPVLSTLQAVSCKSFLQLSECLPILIDFAAGRPRLQHCLRNLAAQGAFHSLLSHWHRTYLRRRRDHRDFRSYK